MNKILSAVLAVALTFASVTLSAQTPLVSPQYPFLEFREQLLEGTNPTKAQLDAVEKVARATWLHMRAMNATMGTKTDKEKRESIRNEMIEQAHAIHRLLSGKQVAAFVANYNDWAKQRNLAPFAEEPAKNKR